MKAMRPRYARVLRYVILALLVAFGILFAAWRIGEVGRLEERPSSPSAPVAAPAPTAVPAPPPRAPEPAKPPPAAAKPMPPTEEQQMERIRALVKPAPREAIALIDDADRAHPQSPLAEERLSLRIDALVYEGDIGVARDHAEEYLRRYPEGAYADHVERLTGVHPRPPMPGP